MLGTWTSEHPLVKLSRHLRRFFGHDVRSRRWRLKIYTVYGSIPGLLLDGAIAIPEKIDGTQSAWLCYLYCFSGSSSELCCFRKPMNTKNIVLYHVISSINHSYPNISKLYHHEVLSELVAISFFGGPTSDDPKSHGIHIMLFSIAIRASVFVGLDPCWTKPIFPVNPIDRNLRLVDFPAARHVWFSGLVIHPQHLPFRDQHYQKLDKPWAFPSGFLK